MQLVIKEKNKYRINKLVEWGLYIVTHFLAFILVTGIFDSVYVDEENPLFWALIIVIIITVLNKTIKPILVKFTIPITGITFGLFYPCINLFLLKIVDWILGNHFILKNIYMALFFAIVLSVANFIVEEIINTILKKVKKHG